MNFEQNNLAKRILMAEFALNNVKNVSTSHTPLQLNCGYYPHLSYKKDISLYSRSKIAKKLLFELCKLMTVAKKTFIILKSFKKDHRINIQDLKAIFQKIYFG